MLSLSSHALLRAMFITHHFAASIVMATDKHPTLILPNVIAALKVAIRQSFRECLHRHLNHLNHLRLHSRFHLLWLHRHHTWLLVLQLVHPNNVLLLSGLSWLSESHLHGNTLLPELILLLLLVLLELLRAHHGLLVTWYLRYRSLIHHHLLRWVVHRYGSWWRLHRHTHSWLTFGGDTIYFLPLCHNLIFYLIN